MSKATDAVMTALKALFGSGLIPDGADYDDLIQLIQDAIQEHEHKATGGAGSGTGDAAKLDHGANLTGLADDDHPQYTPFYNAYVCVRDKKTQGTNGGTFSNGAWRTRDINDEQADPQDICSLDSNQITLAAGTYRCRITAPAADVGEHKLRLYNITDSAVLLVGTSEYTSTSDFVQTHTLLVGRFTLAEEKVLEVQHRCFSSKTLYGLGSACGWTDEIYTMAEFWREA